MASEGRVGQAEGAPAEQTGYEVPAEEAGGREEEHRWLIHLFSELVGPLGRAVPPTSEVVLHDLSRLPNSIVAVEGNVTGRRVGDPATDLLLERATAGELEHLVGYTTTLPDGRSLHSTTMVVRDSAGTPVAALCINSDLSMWQSLGRVAAAMTGAARVDGRIGGPPAAGPAGGDGAERGEVFPRDVDELAAHLIHQAIREQGVPVDLMRKEHKLEVVRALQAKGMFLLRDAVEMIASSLRVTRFTIYNYLNELGDQTQHPGKRADARRSNGKS